MTQHHHKTRAEQQALEQELAAEVSERKRLEAALQVSTHDTEEATRRTHKALNALLDVAELLVMEPNTVTNDDDETPWVPSSTVKRLLELTCSVLDCERIAIMSFDPSTERLLPVALLGFSAELEQLWWQRVPGKRLIDEFHDPALVERMLQEDVLILDRREPPFNANPGLYDADQWLVAPMRVGKQLVGLLSLDYGAGEHEYTGDEQKFAQTMARLIALFLERERLLLERTQAQAREIALQEANARMTEFLGIASHELKTPITTVKGNIQFLMRRLRQEQARRQAGLPEERTTTIEEIMEILSREEQQANRLAQLINDLIAGSRIQTKGLELNFTWDNLTEVVYDVVQQLRKVHPRRVIQISMPPGEVRALFDPDRIEQVIEHYIANALKYAAPERPVEVALQVEVENGTACLSVRDEGPGLSPNELEHIWGRFYQARGMPVRSGSRIGLGLGLYICRAIIEQHGGQVGVQSAPGQGSTFWFRLPLTTPN